LKQGVCNACLGSVSQASLSKPIDYEYGVIPSIEYKYLRCDLCATEWLDPRPASSDLNDFYPEQYHAHNDDHGLIAKFLVQARAWVRGRHYKALLGDKSEGKLFDVGTGDCRHFDELRRFANWTFAGVEIQPAVAAEARRQGYDVETGTLEDISLERHAGEYDVVSMNHVLEHVCEPDEVLARCLALLKPGGILIGQLPTNSSWESSFGKAWAGYHYPRHLQVFSREGLAKLLASQGFSMIKLSSALHCQTAISMQNKLCSMGVNLRLSHGRSKIYSLLLLMSLPFELMAKLMDRSGTIDFLATKPLS
jgi:SAM-dependent methyltransferase